MTATEQLLLNANPKDFIPDPHAGYAKYRPLARLIGMQPEVGLPIVTRYADAEILMSDKRLAQLETQSMEKSGIIGGPLHNFYAQSVLTSNPPVHQKRRKPIARAFAFKLIQIWRPRIRELVKSLLEKCEKNRSFNLLAEISSPLPSYIIAEILGAPKKDAPYFSEKVYEMSKGLAIFTPEHLPRIEQAANDLNEYVTSLIQQRRKEPQNDFLTDYINIVDETGELTEEETLMQIVTLIIGGSDTTRFGFTALIYHLLQNREQWDAVCNNPELAPQAVIEGLRYEPPAGSNVKVVQETIKIDEYIMKPGLMIAISILSAQRDEAVFASPQHFDIYRTDQPKWSLSFGGGAHRCLGEALAKAELEEALIAITQRFPQLKMVGKPPEFNGNFGIRSVTPLNVTI